MPDIPVRYLCSFTQQLATLVGAGLPLLQSLETIAKGMHFQPLRNTILEVRQHISQGKSLQLSLQQAGGFNHFYCQLVAAGEMSGHLDDMLRRLATHLERQNKLHLKVKMALIYPVAVMLIGVAVTAVILIWVVPVFENIFSSFGAQLPAATRLVLQTSQFLLQTGPWALLILLLIWTSFNAVYKRSDDLQLFAAIIGLRLPLAGSLLHISNAAIWTRCMATLIQSGVPLLDTLEVTAGACHNRVYAYTTLAVRHAVSQGRSLSHAMQEVHLALPQLRQQTSVFPTMLIQMVAIGEESGALTQLLMHAAEDYEQTVERQIDSMTQLIEPLLIVLLGGMVGGLVVALYLPVFQLGQVL